MSGDPLIRAEEVSVRYTGRKGEVTALSNMSLDIHRGETVCLVGASGCGKSTFINTVAGFVAPTEGKVMLDGKEISGVEPRCGMVFQDYALFPWMSVLHNVAFGPRLAGVDQKEREERAARWIEMVGLSGFEKAYPGELSGGMRQRVALCRALCNEPDVLLCDEPFAALDAMTRQIMQEELLRIVNQSGQTTIFITHSIDEALILSDRVVVMSARPGRVKALFDNHLPRPRHLDVQLTDDFLALKKEVWGLVQEEVMGSINQRR